MRSRSFDTHKVKNMNEELIDASSKLGSNDDAYQQAVYSPPNYKNLSSASNALEKAIGDFFVSSTEKCDDE